MKNQELTQIHNQLADQITVINALSAQWSRSITIDEKIKAAADLENCSNMLRITTEKLATGTRKLYAGEEE